MELKIFLSERCAPEDLIRSGKLATCKALNPVFYWLGDFHGDEGDPDVKNVWGPDAIRESTRHAAISPTAVLVDAHDNVIKSWRLYIPRPRQIANYAE